MPRQQFDPSDSIEPICIETPEGVITLTWKKRNSKLIVQLPRFMVAARGFKRMYQKARFLARLDDGRVVPRYSLLVPSTDARGEIMGVTAPKVLSIGDKDNGSKHTNGTGQAEGEPDAAHATDRRRPDADLQLRTV